MRSRRWPNSRPPADTLRASNTVENAAVTFDGHVWICKSANHGVLPGSDGRRHLAVRRGQRGIEIGWPRLGNRADHLLGRGIDHREGAAAGGLGPAAIDAQQDVGILEQYSEDSVEREMAGGRLRSYRRDVATGKQEPESSDFWKSSFVHFRREKPARHYSYCPEG